MSSIGVSEILLIIIMLGIPTGFAIGIYFILRKIFNLEKGKAVVIAIVVIIVIFFMTLMVFKP